MLFDERALTDLTDVQFLISSGIEFHSQVSFDKVVLPRKTDWMGCGTFPRERALVVGPESVLGYKQHIWLSAHKSSVTIS